MWQFFFISSLFLILVLARILLWMLSSEKWDGPPFSPFFLSQRRRFSGSLKTTRLLVSLKDHFCRISSPRSLVSFSDSGSVGRLWRLKELWSVVLKALKFSDFSLLETAILWGCCRGSQHGCANMLLLPFWVGVHHGVPFVTWSSSRRRESMLTIGSHPGVWSKINFSHKVRYWIKGEVIIFLLRYWSGVESNRPPRTNGLKLSKAESLVDVGWRSNACRMYLDYISVSYF